MAITAQMRTEVSQLYVALFGRAPDGEGLGFWTQMRDSGKSMADIANIMFLTQPARVYYPTFLSNQEIIGAFYTNVLGRPADAEGLAFWTAKLNAQGASFGTVIAEMIAVVNAYSGTGEPSKSSHDLFVNRVNVAQYYGEHNGTVDGAKAVLAGVTKDAATVTSTKTAIDNGSVPGVNQGLTFVLTVNQDAGPAFTGTTGNDTFLAGAAQDGNGTLIDTLQNVDAIDGGSGLDTLDVTLTTNGAQVNPTIRNIETVKARFTGAAILDLTNATGVESVVVTDSVTNPAVGGLGAIANITAKAVMGQFFIGGSTASALNLTFDSDGTANVPLAVDLGFDAAPKATTANIKTISSHVNIDSDFNDAFTTANINTAGTSSIIFFDSAGTLTTVKVDGGGSLDLTGVPLTALKTLDASAQSGSLKAKVASNAAVTITTGSGNDTIDVSGQAAAGSKIALGAGDDVLKLGAAAAKFDGGVDGGDGTDVMNLSTAAGVTAAIAAKLVAFERLDISGSTGIGVDADILKFDTVQIDEAIAGPLAGLARINNAFDSTTLVVASAARSNADFDLGNSISVFGKDYTGNSESLTVVAKLNDGNKDNTADGNISAMSVTDNGAEKLIVDARVETLDGGSAGPKASAYFIKMKVVGDAFNEVILKGDAKIDLTYTNATTIGAVAKIDGSANSGGTTIDLSTHAVSVSFVGSEGIDTYSASTAGDTLYTAKGADVVTLNAAAVHDVVVYKSGTDSQLADTNKDGKATINVDTGFDVINAFTLADDKIDVTTFGFTGFQNGLVDVSAKVTGAVDLTNVAALFSVVGGSRGAAFSVFGGDTYVFIDANKDGDFKAADDIVIKLAGLNGGLTEQQFNGLGG